MVGPIASLSQLHRSDGSASYKCPATGYSILGAVNGPIELPARRDALKPEEATVEVFVKPGTTTGGVGERYIEGILRSVLGKIVLGREKGFPRRGVVITLAIVGGENVARGDNYLTILPALLHTGLLAMISASVPLSMTFSATLLGVTEDGDIVRDPSPTAAKAAVSLHVFAFSSKNHLLLNESEGRFGFDTWEYVRERALSICQGETTASADGDVAMGEGTASASVSGFIRETVEDQIYSDYAYKLDSI
ncbi:hypothetical protein DTO013E5_3623 [Penicillium roqueforti]|uniref:Genomic scaffold, ProqFM164S02 n=1 Tax=Penicillium roqueforti (strain FM164) TaxID=1365484 RepID=W6Q629_PENRF|nr:uncharacterized protein LCP9604111_425 [Penicillium roqueforti]CDM32163.1 unnamed protein product [Penicillium roqueforti FM164]KAF9252899.1 hypothetical protein LCP9604111_425 [Penicillium roqueforti]KAI1832784.1 hypothetical protein CBS147337_6195 [Penicillium roqueforti]KAI2676009.1 hypothetical protein CBS147355_6190 [Penicillium roqueforti]KAI2679304.1 hypothetical protein LCP963914a_7403 [Penicillium roqueforti]